VTVAVCDKVPEVAVTVMVEVPAGVPLGLELLLLLQPAIPRTTSSITTLKPARITRKRCSALRIRRSVANITHAARAQSKIGSGPRGEGRPGITYTLLRDVVAMLRVVATEVLPGEPLVGLNDTVVPSVGAPDCENVTVCGNPPAPAVTVMGKVAV
jgi:hypothetical protein